MEYFNRRKPKLSVKRQSTVLLIIFVRSISFVTSLALRYIFNFPLPQYISNSTAVLNYLLAVLLLPTGKFSAKLHCASFDLE